MKKYLIILVFTLIGFGSAIYLSIPAYQYWNGADSAALQAMPCDLSDKLSCSGILKNPRAIIFEIPYGQDPSVLDCSGAGCGQKSFKVAFPMIALVVYPILAILALVGYLTGKILFAKIITIMAIGGMVFNGYVISQEIIVGVFCPVCALCTVIITTIAILGGMMWRYSEHTGIHNTSK